MGYAVSYRFVLIADNSQTRRDFIELWTAMSRFFQQSCGALGGRLHHGKDGCFYAVNYWPSRDKMQAAQEITPSEDFTKLRLKWAALCGPSEIVWEGETLVELNV